MKGGSDTSHTYVFYHIYANSNTLDIMRDQISKIIFSGLYKDATQIYCFLAGENEYVEKIKTYIETLPKKFKLEAVGVNDKTYERFTLRKIGGLVNDNDRFLYIHTKGVAPYKGMMDTEKERVSRECIYLWRTYMEYYLIANYKKCLEKLGNHDIVGVAYKDILVGPHFSGNFWWSTGKHFKGIVSGGNIGSEYNDPETYIFKNNPRYFKLDGDSIPNEDDLYYIPMFLKSYVDKLIE